MTKMARGQGSAVEGSLPRPCLGTGIHSPAHRRRRVFPFRRVWRIPSPPSRTRCSKIANKRWPLRSRPAPNTAVSINVLRHAGVW